MDSSALRQYGMALGRSERGFSKKKEGPSGKIEDTEYAKLVVCEYPHGHVRTHCMRLGKMSEKSNRISVLDSTNMNKCGKIMRRA